MNQNNKKEEDVIKKKMKNRYEKAKKINEIKESLFNQHPITQQIITLIEDSDLHSEVGATLSDIEVKNIEREIDLELPLSYKIFLKYFGDGGTWIYTQPIDSIKDNFQRKNLRSNLGERIEIVGEKEIETNSLLFLMTEDANGGAWCWLTSEANEEGEWPLAYYSIRDDKLHYKTENFTEWLKTLVLTKSEVIVELDLDFRLGLG
ncbi:SMI1/KNR4 family protein [uncultured Tenacibaculum sp.]|uniref:SMI1/KNR4 family protein n=1 Tax=uncultured Tenacibaculum sp. TaxID=174713 RepID=UPI0026071A11|nr:SMI1/KNR4 family protein [uncultured Tenacibaculum sp.]